MGSTWLENFISSCSFCTIDFLNIHWYNDGSASDFKGYVEKACSTGGYKPVWITEFQASGSIDEQNTFLEEVIPWLDSQNYVERYAYFMASEGRLISGSTLSALGRHLLRSCECYSWEYFS